MSGTFTAIICWTYFVDTVRGLADKLKPVKAASKYIIGAIIIFIIIKRLKDLRELQRKKREEKNTEPDIGVKMD